MEMKAREGPNGMLLCLCQTSKHTITYKFNYWADPVVHLIRLKSSVIPELRSLSVAGSHLDKSGNKVNIQTLC